MQPRRCPVEGEREPLGDELALAASRRGARAGRRSEDDDAGADPISTQASRASGAGQAHLTSRRAPGPYS